VCVVVSLLKRLNRRWSVLLWCFAVVSLLAAASPAGAVAGYGDVAEGQYYTEPVQWSTDNDITGIDGNCFAPDTVVTRGEASIYMWYMQDQPTAPMHSFDDVTVEGQDAAVSWMFANKITTGTSKTTFSPDTALTRAHLVTFLWRLAGEPLAPDHSFGDVHAPWQQGSVSWAADQAITTGTSKTTFSPDTALTRAHLVTFLWRYQGEPDVTVDPLSPECDPDATLPPVVVPVDGSVVTVPAGPGFVADLGSVRVEGEPGVFREVTEVRVAHSEVGVGKHSRFLSTAGQPVSLDFGGVEPAAQLTLRFATGRAGLKAEHVTPVVWDYEIEAWVPTIGDEVTVRDGEIIVKTAATSSAAVTGTGLDGVTVAADGVGSSPAQVVFLPSWVNPCNARVISSVCDGARKIVTVIIPAFWRNTQQAAQDLLEGVVDIAGLAADTVVEKAREYLPKVMDAIEAGISAGVDAGIALIEKWLLPSLASFLGSRSDPPACSGTEPEWARNGIDFSETGNRDPRLHLCTETASDEDLRVTTVNNRNFGFLVTSSDIPLKNFTAQQPPNDGIVSLLTNEANKFLIDNVEALDGYQWPLSEASFDITEFDRSDRPDSTTQWKITKATATLDAILMANRLLTRAADHIPVAAFALDTAECATLGTSIPGVDFVIEQSTHWIAILSAVGSCLSTVANALAATIIGLPVAAVLEFVAQILETISTNASVYKQQLNLAEIALELTKQPPTLTVQPTEGQTDTTPVQPTEGQTDTIPVQPTEGQTDTTPVQPTNTNNTTPTPTREFKSVSAGGEHSCGIKTDNTLTCWGRNEDGETDGPGGAFTTVSTGYKYSCGVKTDNTVACWGITGGRQTDAPGGAFTTVSTGWDHSCGIKTDNTPTCWGVDGFWKTGAPPREFKSVSAGYVHSCGVETDNTVTCWGRNKDGETDAPGGPFKSVSAGGGHSCGVKTDNTVTCWGRNGEGQAVAPGGAFKTVSAGDAHSCGVKTDNTVTCWGRNSSGQAVAPGGAFKSVSAGGGHSCGVKTDNTVTCWGDNGVGQAVAPGGAFKTISDGGGHSCGVKTDNTVTCWGRNSSGQAVAPGGAFKTVSTGGGPHPATGGGHSCGVRTDNTVTCWGDNWYGQADAPEGAFTTVSAGYDYSCGVKTDNTVTCWGNNEDGETDAPGGAFKTVSAGYGHSCGVRTDNTVTCWGDTSYGETDAPGGAFKTVSAGGAHSCGVRTDNTVTCWGSDSRGKTDAPGGAFKTVSAGGAHSCGVRTDNTVTCWGNLNLRLGSAGGVGPMVAVVRGGLGPTELRAGQGVPCAVNTPTCRNINIELSGFEAGDYTVSCAHDGWGDVGPSTFWTFSVTVDQSGSASLSGPCFLNFARLTGDGAYVTVSGPGVDAVRSNWLAGSVAPVVVPVGSPRGNPTFRTVSAGN